MRIDKDFIERHDLDWPTLKYEGGYPAEGELVHGCRQVYPRGWNSGAFLGNGMVGAMIYKDDPRTLRWELGRSDVTSGRLLPGVDWAIPRVPLGDLLLTPAGTVLKETMHLSLWEAQARGKIVTDRGELEWESLIPRHEDMVLIKVTASGDEEARLGFRPKHGVSPRLRFAARKVGPEELPPPPVQERRGEVDLSLQTFMNGSGLCVARREIQINPGTTLLAAYIAYSPRDLSCLDEALRKAQSLDQSAYGKLKKRHEAWWADFYGKSGISLNDKTWETFYWRQVYKEGCANRPDGVILDSQGPWLTDTTWPTTVWNLNVQLSYTPLITANRTELIEPLANLLLAKREELRDVARHAGFEKGILMERATSPWDFSPSDYTFEIGNLTWALFVLWMRYESTGDKEFLREKLWPLMKEHIEIYRQLLEKREDGWFHIPESSSPEYPSKPGVNWLPIDDCNYTLTLCEWLCRALIKADLTLGMGDHDAAWWGEVADHLAPWPEDETGFRIGADVPYSVSHRHYSHLFMIYPLHLLDLSQPENRERAVRSVVTWIDRKDRLQGYSFTGAANMAATLGLGDRALEYLNGLMDFVHPNTMYSESGPVIETPLSAMESIHYMLLQSWSGTVEIFPALPPSWTEASFDRLLARGGFEVSARRSGGVTEEVRVTSLAGNKLQIRPGVAGDDASCALNLKKGETVVFNREYPRGRIG